MKILDLIMIALKNQKGRWTVLSITGIAISAFCLCFAGAILTTLQQEKSQPCELDVSTESSAGLSDIAIAKLSGIPGVTAVTPLLQIPVTINSGGYSAQLTLTGIDAAYLEDPFTKGGVFPSSSVMPYIILNEVACKQFSASKKETDMEVISTTTTMPNIDWLNAGFTVRISEGTRPVISKVCGVLAGQEGQEPAAYISLPTEKKLLKNNGLSAGYATAKVRAINIGYADSVSKAIATLGFAVGNTNKEQQSQWDTQMKEMVYLIVTGVFSLMCSLVLISTWRKMTLLEQKEPWAMLRWLGMRNKDIDRVFLLQAVLISIFGVAIGTITGLSLPSFLPPELKGVSIFMLPIPAGVVAASAAVCTVFGFHSMLISKGKSLKS